MATAALALDWLAPRTTLIVGPRDAAPSSLPPGTRFLAGEHPRPGPGSLAAGRALRQAALQAGAGELVLVLLSGGGSALAAVPHPALSYAGKRRALDGILAAGLPIGPTNVLRAALSALKGGGLAAAIWPAHSLTLALLDVPASTPWALASGPTLPAPAPRRAAVWRRLPDLQLPPATLQALARAHAAPPPPERRRRGRSTFVVVGVHRLAAAGAAREARRLG
jgi:hydroxypyruvate reductase